MSIGIVWNFHEFPQLIRGSTCHLRVGVAVTRAVHYCSLEIRQICNSIAETTLRMSD